MQGHDQLYDNACVSGQVMLTPCYGNTACFRLTLHKSGLALNCHNVKILSIK